MKRVAKRSARKVRPPVRFDQRCRVEVRPAEFVPFESVAHLDAARLQKAARARIEVGYFETDCCRQVVHATVRRGVVTELALAPCRGKTREPGSKDLARLLKAAQRRVAPRPGRPFRPMPVARFLGQAAAITVKTIVCVQICIFGFCFVCCTTHIQGSPVVCGKDIVIVGTP